VDRANRAGTVIYTMYSAGLQPLAPDAEDRADMTGMNGQAANGTLRSLTHVGAIGGRDVNLNAELQGLAYLALETGGIPCEPGNDLNWGLDRVLEDQQGYYLIGFKPPSDTFEVKHGARGYHHVTVKATRPGLHVRSRTGFFGATDDETMPKYATDLDQMRAAMLSPFRSSGVRLRLTALYAEVPKRGPVVRNLLHIDTRDLTFQSSHGENLATHAAGESSAEIEVVAMATSMGEIPVARVARLYKVQASADRFLEAVREGALYTLDVPVKKRGAYQIQVAVRDMATGKVGSASQFLEIPELKKGRVALTSIVLQDGDRTDGTPAWTGMSPVTRRFHSGSQVEYLCLVENTGNKVLAANLDSQIRIVRDGKSVYTGPAKLVSMDGGGLALTGTLKLALNKISQLPNTPDLLLHTGDITHSSQPEEFDTAQRLINEARISETFYVPGEHDIATDEGAAYRERFGKGTGGSGWYSFNHKGVHFIGLNNCQQVDAMGLLGADQLRWLKADLASHPASTPIIIFAHIPLWMVYPEWGWGTPDASEALTYLRRFGSVTVLNGHIHQVVQKVEGNVAFHTAMSTAFPQPAPGTAPHAGPMVVPAGKLKSVLGIAQVRYMARKSHLAVVDASLEERS